MAVYFAARYGRRQELEEYRRQLEDHGFAVTSRWLTNKPPDDITQLTDADWRQLALVDREDVARSDILVLFTEEGASGGGGRHVEFGIALGLGKATIVVGPMEHLFHRLPDVQVMRTWKDALSLIVSLGARVSFPTSP